jgi:hypothetical protein
MPEKRGRGNIASWPTKAPMSAKITPLYPAGQALGFKYLLRSGLVLGGPECHPQKRN